MAALPREARGCRPKIEEAIATWRWYSREIGADLARFYPGRSIYEWLRGEMDSTELLMLIDGLPDESQFKTWAERGGDWSEAQYIAARTANELALARADGAGYTPELIRSPAQKQAEFDKDRLAHMRRQQGMAELTGKTRTRRKAVL